MNNVSFLGEISGNMNSWTELVQVPGMRLPIMFKLNTGADVSVVPSRLCKGVTLVRTGVIPQLDFLVKGIVSLDIGRFKKFLRSAINAFVHGHYQVCWWKLLKVKWWIVR